MTSRGTGSGPGGKLVALACTLAAPHACARSHPVAAAAAGQAPAAGGTGVAQGRAALQAATREGLVQKELACESFCDMALP